MYWAARTTGLYDDYYIATDHSKVFLSMPSGNRCVVGFGYPNGEPGKHAEKTPEELLEEFKVVGPEMKEIVASIDHQGGMFQDRLNYISIKKWYKRSVVIIGDAKHGLSPVSGFGTSLALEDGYVLAQVLKEKMSIPQSLKKFSKSRNREVKDIYRFANAMEFIILSKSRFLKRIMWLFPTWVVVRFLRKALGVL